MISWLQKNDIPLILGVGLAPTNVARTSNKGIDGQLGFQTRLGQVDFNTNFVFSYAKNKVEYKAEAQQKISMVGSDWKTYRTNLWIYLSWGIIHQKILKK